MGLIPHSRWQWLKLAKYVPELLVEMVSCTVADERSYKNWPLSSLQGGHSKLGWQNIPEFCEKFGDEQCSVLVDFFLAQIPALKEVVEKEGIHCDFALRRSFNVFYDEKVANSLKDQFEKYKHIPYAKQVDFVAEKYLEQVN